MVGVGGGFSHIDWVGVVVGGVKTSFCTSLGQTDRQADIVTYRAPITAKNAKYNYRMI